MPNKRAVYPRNYDHYSENSGKVIQTEGTEYVYYIRKNEKEQEAQTKSRKITKK